MLLSKEKLIYIHIPKTGGSSVEDFLLSNFNYKRSVLNLTDGIGKSFIKNKVNDGFETLYPLLHYTLSQVIEVTSQSNIQVDNSWNLFSIVRNPYYKFLSELFYAEKIPLIQHFHTLPNQIDRDRLVNESIDLYFGLKHNTTFHSNHSLPQYKFFEGVDLNYKIFKFEDGLPNIMNKLGFNTEGEFPHRLDMFNILGVPKPNYRDVLTPYLVEVVNERYQKDFEMFGYNMLSPLDI